MEDDGKCPMPIKIQLNSERAVMKLVADDPELQMLIKKSILSGIAKETVMQDVVNAAKHEINEIFVDQKRINWDNCYVLKPEYKKLLEENAKFEIGLAVEKEVYPKIEALNNRLAQVEQSFNNKLDKFLEHVTEYVVSEAVQKEINRRVDEKLSSIKEALEVKKNE